LAKKSVIFWAWAFTTPSERGCKMVKEISRKKWRVLVSVRVAGEVIQKKATVYGKEIDAKKKEIELRDTLKGSLTKSQKSTLNTFGEAISLFLNYAKAQGKLSLSHASKFDWLHRELGHISIDGFIDVFDAWYNRYCNMPKANGELKKASTKNQPVNLARIVFNHLINRGIIEKNPIDKFSFPKQKVMPKTVTLTDSEIEKVYATIKRLYPHILPIIKYMANVPCRVTELTTAKKEQYDCINNLVRIPVERSKNKLAMTKPVFDEMTEYFRNIPNACPYLFYHFYGGRYRQLTYPALSKIWRVVRVKAGFPNLTIHDLRHVAVSNLIKQGIPLWQIKKIAGWTATSSMLDTYFNVSADEAAYETMEILKKKAA